MSARGFARALDLHQHEAQLLVSCVTPSVFGNSGFNWASGHSREMRAPLTLNRGVPVRLAASPAIFLNLHQLLRVYQPSESGSRIWKAEIIQFFYTLSTAEDLEICSYQWHPEGKSHIKTPHLHIGRGATGNVATFGPRGLHRVHFPTGEIGLADFLQLAISEFGVEPRREDWEQVLARE